MNEFIESKKINLKKQIKIIWLIIAILGIIVLIMDIISYIRYNKAQIYTASLMLIADEDTGSGNFSTDEYKSDRKKVIKEMYDYLTNTYPYTDSAIYGSAYNEAVREAAREFNVAISNYNDTLDGMLRKSGYKKDAKYYLKYTNFVPYIFNLEYEFLLIEWLYIIILFINILLNVYYKLDRKTKVSVNNGLLICKKINGKSIKTPIENVKSIETIKLKGLSFKGDGFKYKIILIKNNEELRNEILNIIPSNDERKSDSDADIIELKKYKDLLDSGAITEEEYNQKKKQILNL